MATYLEELHELFPNGLHASVPSNDRNDPNLLIPLFDDFEVQDIKDVVQNSTEAHDLVDAILYQIDPSLVSKEAVARLSPGTLPDRSNQATDGLKPSKPVTGSVVPAKSRTDLQSDSLTTTRQVEKAEAEPIPSSSRTSPELLQGLAGKAIARKYDVYSSDKTESTLTRVPNPILVPRRSPPSSAEKMKSTSISQPPSPITSVSTSVEASPTYTRFLNIAGRSSRDQAEAEAARLKASGVSSKPQVDSDSQPGRTSIFNKTSIRPALPPKRNGTSSESDGSPPSTRQSSYRSRPAPAPIKYRGPSKAINGRVTELPTVHRWELNEIEKPRSFVQGRYISSGEIIDPVANMRKADFTGYQNGWKPVSSRFSGGHSGGNVLGASPSRRQKADHNGAEEEERDAGPAPFHWTGDVDVDPGKRRFIGKGALGSRPGTFKNRSDERFAAATAALQREKEAEYSSQAPDPLEDMHPAAASWEMQRRGILMRSDKRLRVPQAA